MENREGQSQADEFEWELNQDVTSRYVLRLYVTGTTYKSGKAITTIRKLCEEYLEGRYELTVIDIYQQPELARKEQVIAAPTLIKQLPLPLRKLIGDLSNVERVLAGLSLDPKGNP